MNDPLPSDACPHLWVKTADKEYWLPLHGPLGIGGKKDNDLVLGDDFISGNHCRIEPLEIEQEEAWQLLDQNSTNGLYVNGNRVSTCELTDGDIIQVGRCSLIFVTPE